MNKKISMFYYYIASFIIICLIPSILIGVILLTEAVGTVRKEVEKTNFDRLKQSMTTMDRRFQEFMNMVYQISSERRLTSENIDEVDRYDRMKLSEILNNFRKTSLMVDEICLFYPNKDIVLSTTGTMTAEAFSNMYVMGESKDWEGVEKNLRNALIVSVEKVTSKKRESGGETQLAFLYPISSSNSQNILVALFVKEQTLTDLIEGVVGEYNGVSCIFDYNNRIIVKSSNNFDLDSQILENLAVAKDDMRIQEIVQNGRKLSVMQSRSKWNRYTYMTIIPSVEFWYQVNNLRNLIVLVIIIAIVIGIIFSFIFAKGFYNPIRKLAEFVGASVSKSESGKSDYRNELDIIKNSTEVTFNRTRELVKRIEDQKELYEQQILLKIINGKATAEEQELLEPQTDGHSYCIYLVEIQQVYGIDLSLISDAIFRNENIHISSVKMIPLPDRESIAVVALFSISGDEVGQERKNLAELLSSTFTEHSGGLVYVTVGSICNFIAQLNRSYIEASAAIGYRILKKDRTIFYFEDISEAPQQQYTYPINEQMRLIHAVYQGDVTVAVENVIGITSWMYGKNMSLLMARYICFDIINSLVKAIADMNIGDFSVQVEELMRFSSLPELEIRLKKLIEDVCAVIDEQKEIKQENSKKLIVNYIKQNFRENHMSLGHIADEFKVPPFYMSRLVKDVVGQSFTDYLTSLRVEYVKKLLIESDRTMKDIIHEAGYIDHASFIRRFRQLEECTPGQYRENHKKF